MRSAVSRRLVLFTACVISILLNPVASAYPLDGHAYTGVPRLQAQRMIQEGELAGRKRPPGELLPMKRVDLRLVDRPDFSLPSPDPQFTAKIKRLLGNEAGRYSIALLDLSEPAQPRYAEWQGNQAQNPGSVGKLMVGLAIFQALADIYPEDINARENTLRNSVVCADVFSVYDHHTVPFWNADTKKLIRRPIKQGDCASLWTYLDWMMSPSSNSAAGMVQKHLILLAHFGRQYPVTEQQANRFFAETTARDRAIIFETAMQSPIPRNGLDLNTLRQGSFFTREGKRRVAGTSSRATSRGLMEFILKMEQGKLVDMFSSRELKRLLYITERRIRYASTAALRNSAVYFKSGSLYSCEPEPGFQCKKYHGNKRNYMNSVAIVESPAGQNRLYYMTTLLSNVLRKNSAVDHRDLAGAIHRMLLEDHPREEIRPGAQPLSATYGEGFIGYQSERKALELKLATQEALLTLDYEIGEIDGIIGSKTRAAIGDYQRAEGLTVDGKPSPALLQNMRDAIQRRRLARPQR